MGRRGRRSASDNVAIKGPAGLGHDLEAPDHLGESERQIFSEVVAKAPPGHFTAVDIYLLATFSILTNIIRTASQKLADYDGKDRMVTFKELDSASKSQAAIATKLRLVPSARITPRTAARQGDAHRPSVYDEMAVRGWTV